MNTTATQPLDVFESANTGSDFEDRLRAGLPLWAQSSVTTALLHTGFACGTTYTATSLALNVNNKVRMRVISTPDGHTFTIVLTENEDNLNFHGFIVALNHGEDIHELADNVYIPVRVYFGSDGTMCVKYNEGRTA